METTNGIAEPSTQALSAAEQAGARAGAAAAEWLLELEGLDVVVDSIVVGARSWRDTAIRVDAAGTCGYRHEDERALFNFGYEIGARARSRQICARWKRSLVETDTPWSAEYLRRLELVVAVVGPWLEAPDVTALEAPQRSHRSHRKRIKQR